MANITNKNLLDFPTEETINIDTLIAWQISKKRAASVTSEARVRAMEFLDATPNNRLALAVLMDNGEDSIYSALRQAAFLGGRRNLNEALRERFKKWATLLATDSPAAASSLILDGFWMRERIEDNRDLGAYSGDGWTPLWQACWDAASGKFPGMVMEHRSNRDDADLFVIGLASCLVLGKGQINITPESLGAMRLVAAPGHELEFLAGSQPIMDEANEKLIRAKRSLLGSLVVASEKRVEVKTAPRARGAM